MKKLLVMICLLFEIAAYAQHKGVIVGTVLNASDSSMLQAATVTVFRKADSSVVNYQITDEQGGFKISDLPLKTSLYVLVSHTGYAGFSKGFFLDSAARHLDLKQVGLVKDTGQMMEEVVVKSVAPVTMNGDTLEINPAAIRIDSTEVAEELLLRVPGVVRWQDSSFSVNGKKVTRLYVDGRPFFDGGFDLAMKNLPKHAIDKIQVYQEKDIYKQSVADAMRDSTVVMNIKLKPEKRKGHFGNVTANIGTNRSYGGNTSMQVYNKKTNIGMNGNVNNTKRALGNTGVALQNKDLNIRNNWNAGTTFRQHFSDAPGLYEDKSLNGSYNISGNRSSSITDRTTVKNLADSKLTDIHSGYNLSRSLTQFLNTSYGARKKEKHLSLNATYNHNNTSSSSEGNVVTYRNDSLLASRSANKNRNESASNSFNLNGDFNNTSVNEDPDIKSFSVNYAMGYTQTSSNSNTYSKFESLTDSTYTNLYDRKYVNKNSGFNGNMALRYNGLRRLLFGDHNFWHINIGLNNNIQYNRSEINADVSDRDSSSNAYILNPNLTNQSGTSNINNNTGLRFEKTFFKNITDRYHKSIQVSTNLQNQLLYQKNTSTLSYRNRTFIYNFFTPSSTISYNYNKIEKYNVNMILNHNSFASAPTIDQLYPIQDSAANRYHMIVGNPNLKSRFNNNYNFNVSLFKNRGLVGKKSYNANVNLRYNREKNGITDSTLYDDNGGSTTYYINTPGARSFNAGFNAGASLIFNKTTLQLNANGGYGTGLTYFSNGRGNSNSLNGGVQVNLAHALQKNSLQVSYNNNYSQSESPRYINRERLTYRNKNLNQSVSLSFSAPGIIDASVQQSVSTTRSDQSGGVNPYPAASTRSYNTGARFTLKVPKRFTLGSDFRYSNNISVNAQPIRNINWDAHAGYAFSKRKLFEAKVAVFNILGQNQNVNSFSSGNITTTSVSQGLQRFFQFTLTYFPRQFGGSAR